ncbi:uncharacterized protein LOC124253779 [Haliotis rubra]|uniref:uncharacterized protein LOC124253779 n=1 Tax=Haliotis rubra TaxID=36100 RepID=UPI001EE5553C|nr:uncharacterized protein LOC124253779 [Haliotis rubra]XP_046543568.1 uncharacterized protein LOC124253779 [Haliotis rubra]
MELLILATLVLARSSCYGDEMASHLLLLDQLPEGISAKNQLPLVIRTNYSGSVRFQESDDFRVVLNVTSPSLQDAYSVQADLVPHRNALLLQVYKKSAPAGFSLLWLFVGIAAATFLVFVCAAIYAVCWISSEQCMYDLAERKSYASSSQPGIYRSRNSMQMALQQGDIALLAEEADNIHNDDTLKRVPEMPEEEEAEAIEMEELRNKDKGEDFTDRGDEASVNITEKNLVKSRYHTQSKTIHKDLLKKGKRKRFRRGKPHSETYDTVMEYPENSSEGSGASEPDGEDKEEEGKGKHGAREHYVMKPGREMTTFHPKLTRSAASDPNHRDSEHPQHPILAPPQTAGANPGDDATRPDSADPADLTDPNYSPFLVQADVHQIGLASEILRNPPDKRNTGNPGHVKAGVAPVPIPVKVPQRKVAFSDDERNDPKSCHEALEIFQEVSRRYDLGQRLGVIRESVTEDTPSDMDGAEGENRYSQSIYGSSEIFETDLGDRVYFDINDSDLELPPIDSGDDRLSDGSVPNTPHPGCNPHSSNPGNPHNHSNGGLDTSSCGGFNTSGPQTSLKPNLKNTGFTTFGTSSPHTSKGSDDVPRESGCESSSQTLCTPPTRSAGPDSDSPPLPPPPEDIQPQPVEADASFDFPPPPPKLMKIPEQGLWKQQTPAKGDNYNYVDFQKTSDNSDPKEELRKPTLTGHGKTYQGPKYLHLTLLSITCVLGIIGGVYSQAYTNTIVHITVYAPGTFLSKTATVFFHRDSDGEVFYEKLVKVERFDVSDPVLANLHSELCRNSTCDHRCDDTTGHCICRKGFKMGTNGKCQDVNECMEGGAKCHPTAGCLNSMGLYECICPDGFYGDGKTCQECRVPCNPGTYEVQPCTNTTHKICRDCTKVCPDGYFMLRPCKSDSNSHCRACQKQCSFGEFEYQTCQRDTNRECRSHSLLPTPEGSQNIILESLYGVVDQKVEEDYLPSMQSGNFGFTLDRASDLKVKVTMKSVQAAQLYVPINSSEKGSFRAIPQSGTQSQILRQFCPHPVPDHYILHHDKLMNITYSLDDNQKAQPCQSFETVGNFPGSSSAGPSHFLYPQPGPMTDLFDGIRADFFKSSTVWVEKSKRCQHYSKRCEDCTRDCARQMTQSSSECSVLGSESDNGYSPRLRVCYTCCARSNCSDICKDYHKRHCQPRKCLKSNWMEFHIRPQWDSSRMNHFYCHIKPLPRQHLLELEFSLQYQGQSFYKGKVSLKGNKQWEKEGRMNYKDKIVHVKVDSRLGAPPDFLEGEVSGHRGIFRVGHYRNQGPSVFSSVIGGESVSIRPKNPFGEMDTPVSDKNYDRDVLENSVLATETEGPYEISSDLMVVTYLNDTFPYHVTHKNAAPHLEVSLPKEVSILASVFERVTLQHKTIRGSLVNNNTHWVVGVSGRVKTCPGLLMMEVYDPGYPTEAVFKYWVALKCPRKFHIKFSLPTSDLPHTEKEVVLMITDVVQTHQIRIHNPGHYEKVKVGMDDMSTTSDTASAPDSASASDRPVEGPAYGVVFSIPYLASVCGAVILLLFLAVFGLALAPDSIGPELPALRWHHTCMMIGYVTLNFLYSIVVTMTVFTIIVLAVNKDNSQFVSQFKQQSFAKTAVHHLELLAMQRHLEEEINRQNEFASLTKIRCEDSMKPVIEDMHKLLSQLLEKTADVFEQQNIVTLLSEHSHEVLTKLSQNMFTFRNNFHRFVRNLLAQLSHDIESSLMDVENNRWLAGARFLHGAVINIRKHLNNVSSKQFLDWANLKHNLARLTDEMTVAPPLPNIPHIEGIPTPTTHPPGARNARNLSPTQSKTRKVRIHSHWFYPFGTSSTGRGHVTSRPLGQDDTKVTETPGFMSVFYVFLALMLCVDFLLFLHRFSKTIAMGRLLLYGYPEYVDCREKPAPGEEDMEDDVFQEDGKDQGGARNTKTFLSRAAIAGKKFFIQVVSTLFIPKAAVTVVLCVIIYTTVCVTEKIFTQDMLKSVGLHYDMNKYLGLQQEMINSRILSHAEQINSVEYPSYQSWMVAYIERHQRILEVHRQELEAMRSVHNETYCRYLTHLGMNVNCSAPEDTVHTYRISTPGCRFAPVWPNFYFRSPSYKDDIADQQLKTILEGMRQIIINTCQTVAVFMSIVVLKELFGVVLWIFIRRSGFVRLRIIFETTEEQTIRDG